jgi:DNA repair exonuclease SbcCD ATPase subunit
LDGAVKKYNPIIEEAMSELESEKNNLKEKRLALEQSIETVDKSEHDVVEHVKSSFAVLRAALEEREKQLIAMAEKEVGNEKQTLRGKLDLIDKRSGDIDEKYQELKRCKVEGNVEDMFKVTQNIRDYKPLDPSRGRDLDDRGIAKFTFNDRDEKYLSVKLQNYGDISTRMGSTLPTSRTSSTSSYRYSYHRP